MCEEQDFGRTTGLLGAGKDAARPPPPERGRPPGRCKNWDFISNGL